MTGSLLITIGIGIFVVGLIFENIEMKRRINRIVGEFIDDLKSSEKEIIRDLNSREMKIRSEIKAIERATESNQSSIASLNRGMRLKIIADEFLIDNPKGAVEVLYKTFEKEGDLCYYYVQNSEVKRVRLKEVKGKEIKSWGKTKIKEKDGMVTITNKNNENQKFIVDKEKETSFYLDEE